MAAGQRHWLKLRQMLGTATQAGAGATAVAEAEDEAE